ncbi:hypothetical protein CYLTODRAFT_119383 [Cylindrobasidium torrendii FP15055 ss-10]|uniref:Uncharacterized protein n=1 Tax=Cylindrobasidium torrendii FP15055 ss-10 TaxID=1314674 RepID=A0A0D7B170_9AGAR|nr:hypothetical protein CYLTODRAFT_119383 [Cylindrobasidium torrendii FP15055 ss-10]
MSYIFIIWSLGTAPPVVWSILIRDSPWLNRLSPRDLDDWPSDEVDLGAYLWLIDSARHNRPAQSPSVFQDPVDFFAFLHPIFKSLGWYCWDSWFASWWLHPSLMPLQPCPYLHCAADDDLIGDSPPPDEDAVWEPAVYPSEWPPLPAPTWAQAWEAADVMWKSQEAKRAARREAQKKAWEAEDRERDAGAKVREMQKKVLEFGDEFGKARDKAEEALKGAERALGKAREEKERAMERWDNAEEVLKRAMAALGNVGEVHFNAGKRKGERRKEDLAGESKGLFERCFAVVRGVEMKIWCKGEEGRDAAVAGGLGCRHSGAEFWCFYLS